MLFSSYELVYWIQSWKPLLFCIRYLHMGAEHWAEHVLYIMKESKIARPNKTNIAKVHIRTVSQRRL